MKDIGRNDPCPCGSGKKYKKCCWVSDQKLDKKKLKPDEPINNQLKSFLKTYSKIDLFKILGALQLIPKNHGKNVRFEELSSKILENACLDAPKVPHLEVEAFFSKYYMHHYLEDPISTFHTESIIFFYGNYIVFPGINVHGTRILNLYLEAIFVQKNSLPEEFNERVRNGVFLILALSDLVAKNSGLKRHGFEEDSDTLIKILVENELLKLKESVTFTIEKIQDIANHYRINRTAINDFIIESDSNAAIETEDAESPFITKPFFKTDQEIILVMPTAIVNCLLEFIIRVAKEMDCFQELLTCYFDYQWKKTREVLDSFGWKETTIELPLNPLNLNVNEKVFSFDNDKLAYVCLVRQSAISSHTKEESKHEQSPEEPIDAGEAFQNPMEEYDSRERKVIEYLEKLNKENKHKYFSLYIISEFGKDVFFLGGRTPEKENQSLSIGFCEIELLSHQANIDNLTLWKFAKAINIAQKRTQVTSFGGTLEAYAIYRDNHESFLPVNESVPDVTFVAIGNSIDLERSIIEKRDEHAALKFTDKGLVPIPVFRCRDYAPIYKQKEKIKLHLLLIECYQCPVWVTNYQAPSKEAKEFINSFTEAVVFWLYKMSADLFPYFNQFLNREPVEFQIYIEPQLLDSFKTDLIEEKPLVFTTDIEENRVKINIPFEIAFWLYCADNVGEQELMKSVLLGLRGYINQKEKSCKLEESNIKEIISKIMQPSNAKMILFNDSLNNPKLDSRMLLPFRAIQDYDISRTLECIVSWLPKSYKIPSQINTLVEKVKLCNKIVEGLIEQLDYRLKEFNAGELVKWLLHFHERCVYEKAIREIRIPAKIACFSDFNTEVEKFDQTYRDVTGTTLALRCLIEFVGSRPYYGTKWPNIDDIDELLAIVDQVIRWGMLSDSIHLGLENPDIGLLPSGRIGTTRQSSKELYKPFYKVKLEEEIFEYEKDFDFIMEKRNHELNDSSVKFLDKLNEAFIDEWGISWVQIKEFIWVLIAIGEERKEQVVEMDEDKLFTILSIKIPDFDKELIIGILTRITIPLREKIDKPPEGFDQSEIYPWKYNREISFLRRPVICIKLLDGNSYYYWSKRHLISSLENVIKLVHEGRLKASIPKGKLKLLLNKINLKKGKVFRDLVCEWLKKNSNLGVIDFEIEIKPNGHLNSPENLGDIDILAINDAEKKVFSIECKNTVEARIIHEMKTEIDSYLGKDGVSGKIIKHLKRDEYLKRNIHQIKEFVTHEPGFKDKVWSDIDKYVVISIIITSNEIPLPFITSHTVPFPIISFTRMKRMGVVILNEIS